MQLPALNIETAFAMTALASWAMVGTLWLIGRNYPRQGVVWMMGSVFASGLGYLLVALSTTGPQAPLLIGSYCVLGMACALATVGMRRFLQRPWQVQDSAVLLLPLALPLLWAVMAQGTLALQSRLSNVGFLLQLGILVSVVWCGRRRMDGHGGRVMLAGLAVQVLSLLPMTVTDGSTRQTMPADPTWIESLTSWAVCIVMFSNIQVSVLSYLMLLLDRRNAEERVAAEIDLLTQLPNRRSLERRLEQVLPALYRQRDWLGVVLLDIDHFKQVNDTLGHDAGDVVLQQVAAVLRQQLRHDELLARYGGEEFIVLLPHATPPHATAIAERLVRSVASRPVPLPGQAARTVTISAGVHAQRLSPQDLHARDGEPHWRTLVPYADAALYEAKRSGRNRHRASPPVQAQMQVQVQESAEI